MSYELLREARQMVVALDRNDCLDDIGRVPRLIDELRACVERCLLERDDARKWAEDTVASMQCDISCVYCGHVYGPVEQRVAKDVLLAHVGECTAHPVHTLTAERDALRTACGEIAGDISTWGMPEGPMRPAYSDSHNAAIRRLRALAGDAPQTGGTGE